MSRLPIRDLIVHKKTPLLTLELKESSIGNPQETVETYIYTDTIRNYFSQILETVAQGKGQGFWVEAEYGSGKTHFLATLTALLSDFSDELWNLVTDPEIRRYQRRLKDGKLFPVIISLRGEASNDALSQISLFDVLLEKGFRDALNRLGLPDKVKLTSSQDILSWFKHQDEDQIALIKNYIQKKSGMSFEEHLENGDEETAAQWMQSYLSERKIQPIINRSIKDRLAAIYHQITQLGYAGLLVIIDEYEGWSNSHLDNLQARAHDEDLLETLGYLLWKELNLSVHTIVASQSSMPAKLRGGQEGDRYINFPLLASRNEHDYDIIASRRVRGLNLQRIPEILDHYRYYQESYDFARKISEENFKDTFPFQPRCFEVVRHITMRDLPGPRSGIRILYDVLQGKDLLDKETLIRVCDLLASDHLAQCLSTPVYEADFNAYNIALESLPSLDLSEPDNILAKEILGTLYLWYEANSDRPQKSLSIKELAEATLMTNTGITPEDNVLLVLDQIQSLSQIKFEGDSAQFVPSEDDLSPLRIFREFVRKAKQDPFTLASTWNESLQWKVLFTHGQAGLFSDLDPDRPVTRSFDFRNFQYAGEVVLGSQWHLDWGMQITAEDQHFRFVLMEANVAQRVKSEDLQDPRIAVIYPAQLADNANEAAAIYLAWKRMSETYQNQVGRDADLVRGWLSTQQQLYINELLLTQLSLYRNGTVITRDGLAISAREVFERVSFDQRISFMVEKVLSAAYKQPLVDGNQLRSILTASEAGKVFEGYFGKNPGPTQTTATRNYGVGLGLSTLDQPAQFAPHDQNPVLTKIAELLATEKGGDLKVYRIFDTLSAPPYGLPYVAIQLYILAFVRRGNPRTELTLKYGHKLKTRNGQPFVHGRITAASIAELQWKPDLSSSFDTLIPSAGPNWNDVLPYARQFIDDLHTTTDQAEIELETLRLVEKLVSTEESIQQLRSTVQVLERALGSNLSASDLHAISGINQLVQYRDNFEVFFEKAEEIYPSPDELREDMKALIRTKNLGNIAAQVAEVKRYLDGVVLRDADRELNLQKISLSAQINFNNLATQPHLWDSIEASFQEFKKRYRNEIQKHHRDTNIELEKLNTSLEDAPNQLGALSLLNGISELGTPLGGDLQERYKMIISDLKPCSIKNYIEVTVDSSPVCEMCHRKLTFSVPTQDVKDFQKRLTAALSEQQRRLASETIRRVLNRKQGDALEQFMHVIQAANLIELVRILDENIVHAIRQLLLEEQIMTAESPVLSNFLQKYHSIEEKDIPAAVEEFKKLLVAAFNVEKRNHPDKKTIRLSLK